MARSQRIKIYNFVQIICNSDSKKNLGSIINVVVNNKRTFKKIKEIIKKESIFIKNLL